MKIWPVKVPDILMGGTALIIGITLMSLAPAAAQDKTTPIPLPTAIVLPSLTPSAAAAQPVEQQTLDAIVADLIAQTQQASIQVGGTQTVEAALNQALTATTEAQMQTTATVQAALSGALTATAAASTDVPFLSSALEVVAVVESDLRAGPGNTSAYLAPDGQRFMYMNSDEICVYDDNMQEERCVSMPDDLNPDVESPYWSPDSAMVAFHNDFYITFRDPDIWVLAANDGSLTNLTEDQVRNAPVLEDTWSKVDVVPRWLMPDRILFVRYSREDGNAQPIQLLSLGLDGTAPELIGTIVADIPFPITSMDISDDGTMLAYNYVGPGDSANNGAWISAIDGSGARQVFASQEFMPTTVDLSPDGRYLLTIAGAVLGSRGPQSPAQAVRVIDLETGAITVLDEDVFIRGAGWSPSGSALAYLVTDLLEPENGGLYIADVPTEPGRLVLEGNYIVPTPRQQQTLIWSSSNSILLSEAPEFNLRLVQLG